MSNLKSQGASIVKVEYEGHKSKEAIDVGKQYPELTLLYRTGWPDDKRFKGISDPEVQSYLEGHGYRIPRGTKGDGRNLIYQYLQETLERRMEALASRGVGVSDGYSLLYEAFWWNQPLPEYYLRSFWKEKDRLKTPSLDLWFESVVLFAQYLTTSESFFDVIDLWEEAIAIIEGGFQLSGAEQESLLKDLKDAVIRNILDKIDFEILKDENKKGLLVKLLRSLVTDDVEKLYIEELLTFAAQVNKLRDPLIPGIEFGMEELDFIFKDWPFWRTLLARGIRPNSQWVYEQYGPRLIDLLEAIEDNKEQVLAELSFLKGME